MLVGSLGQEDPLEEGMQPTPVFLPGASHGQKSLKGYIVHGVSKRRTGPNRLSAHTHRSYKCIHEILLLNKN